MGSKQQILSETHYGLDIYAHILREYYQGETVLSLSGRTCAPARNPFNADKPTLLVVIIHNEALHTDSDNAIAEGNAFDFAELHYKLRDNELLQTLNSKMHLQIGEKKDFYSRSNPATNSPQSPICPIVHEKKEVLFSFYKSPIKNTVPHKTATLLQIYNAITGDFYKEKIEKLRSITDPRQARQFKANNFDYCTFSGVFTSRNDKNLVQHSGLMAVDFDHLPNLEEVRQALLADDYFDTQLLFVSPSGDGLKWIISIDTSQTPHAEYFAAVAIYILQTYSIEVDKSGRDVSRACFLPHDPNAFIHPNNL